MQRSYNQLQSRLQPDSTLFLGDLFDGGREWATAETTSPDRQYKQYGTNFWLREYTRFSSMFLKDWTYGSVTSTAAPMGRRLIASVPGNHDLGFANGIQPAVKSRFDAYFGPMNRIDVIGNHSVVSLDTVSLSAMDQVDPKDGSAGSAANEHIWKPTEDFLQEAKSLKHRAVQREWQRLRGNTNTSPSTRFPAHVQSLEDAPRSHGVRIQDTAISSSRFPSIVLSHVPLFRSGDASCGPLRERGNAIPLAAGYQYQNALTPLISSDVVKHLVPEEIAMIYSGDDHDYCEIEHNEFTGRIKEITVKSISWAMGVRKPGVQLVSLWNPIDTSSSPSLITTTPRNTVQNQLCLLPDQLSIFIRYAQLLALTLVILAISAVRTHRSDQHTNHDRSQSLLPITSTDKTSASSSDSDHQPSYLKTRPSKLGGYGNLPPSSRSASPVKSDPFASKQNGYLVDSATNTVAAASEGEVWETSSTRSRRRGAASRGRIEIFLKSLRDVAVVVLLIYGFLLWNG